MQRGGVRGDAAADDAIPVGDPRVDERVHQRHMERREMEQHWGRVAHPAAEVAAGARVQFHHQGAQHNLLGTRQAPVADYLLCWD